jgi:hypothetical protein
MWPPYRTGWYSQQYVAEDVAPLLMRMVQSVVRGRGPEDVAMECWLYCQGVIYVWLRYDWEATRVGPTYAVWRSFTSSSHVYLSYIFTNYLPIFTTVTSKHNCILLQFGHLLVILEWLVWHCSHSWVILQLHDVFNASFSHTSVNLWKLTTCLLGICWQAWLTYDSCITSTVNDIWLMTTLRVVAK